MRHREGRSGQGTRVRKGGPCGLGKDSALHCEQDGKPWTGKEMIGFMFSAAAVRDGRRSASRWADES